MLVRSAFSANIKERRDCSTALFDERGRMIAQAEHIPVHLGAMPAAVAAVMRARPGARRGVGAQRPLRRRHAPPRHHARLAHRARLRRHPRTSRRRRRARARLDARGLAHARGGGSRDPADPARRRRRRPTSSAQMRNPEERRGDLRAQLAAHRLAEQRIAELCARRGHDTRRRRDGRAVRVLGARDARRDRGAARRTLRGARRARGRSTGRSRSTRAVTIEGDAVEMDFAGTSPQHDGNLNCPLVVARSACFYVVRVPRRPGPPCVRRGVRAGDRARTRGLPRQRAPARRRRRGERRDVVPDRRRRHARVRPGGRRPGPGTGDDEQRHARQRAVHLLRDDRRRTGRVPDADGPSGVHVAMSNTLSTPVEALELQYPLRVERYALRPGSGGAGRHRGGDGVVRELRVLEDCRLSIISERREHAPQGERGGDAGRAGPEQPQRRAAARRR